MYTAGFWKCGCGIGPQSLAPKKKKKKKKNQKKKNLLELKMTAKYLKCLFQQCRSIKFKNLHSTVEGKTELLITHFVYLLWYMSSSKLPIYSNFSEVLRSKISLLTHFQPMFHFHTPWKHQKTRGFYVFRGYRSGTFVENGFMNPTIWVQN